MPIRLPIGGSTRRSPIGSRCSTRSFRRGGSSPISRCITSARSCFGPPSIARRGRGRRRRRGGRVSVSGTATSTRWRVWRTRRRRRSGGRWRISGLRRRRIGRASRRWRRRSRAPATRGSAARSELQRVADARTDCRHAAYRTALRNSSPRARTAARAFSRPVARPTPGCPGVVQLLRRFIARLTDTWGGAHRDDPYAV